jgi:hypothetical protein
MVAFGSVALYQLPYALENINTIPNEPIKPGASILSPGYISKQNPSDPVKPGASQYSPESNFKEIPPNPVEPGASQISPGHLSKDTPA